ncbi:MAG TPA: alpha-L-arabinofuranosidase C-terminal domain-containing protein, partial [Kribbellaceae bacterium]
RKDVLELVRELGVSLVRYPGGNFVSGYRWEDGVGPVEQRPRRLDLAWHSLETNEFGLAEFMRWAGKAAVEPLMAVNLGTRGVQEAVDLLEYTNIASGTRLSELRRSHGAEAPYGIRAWCLGNEMDGPWQIGHKTAREYGRLAAETARAMRMVQPDLELVACGSSGSSMPTFGNWEREVLQECYDLVDHISCHAYYEETGGDVASFLASGVDMDHFVDTVTATADAVGAALGNRKRINISFDEWNVWYQSRFNAEGAPRDWPFAPRLLEDVYNVTDAVVVGGLLISLLRHSDRVGVACQSQLVNVIGPIMTEPGGTAWRQTIFHPFAVTSRLATGEVLRVETTAPEVETARFGPVPAVDAVATYDADAGRLAVFLVNRSVDGPVEVTVDLRSMSPEAVTESVSVYDADRHAVNTADQPDRVHPEPNDSVRLDGGTATLTLPPISWTAVQFATR